jgi:hypothetical protein
LAHTGPLNFKRAKRKAQETCRANSGGHTGLTACRIASEVSGIRQENVIVFSPAPDPTSRNPNDPNSHFRCVIRLPRAREHMQLYAPRSGLCYDQKVRLCSYGGGVTIFAVAVPRHARVTAPGLSRIEDVILPVQHKGVPVYIAWLNTEAHPNVYEALSDIILDQECSDRACSHGSNPPAHTTTRGGEAIGAVRRLACDTLRERLGAWPAVSTDGATAYMKAHLECLRSALFPGLAHPQICLFHSEKACVDHLYTKGGLNDSPDGIVSLSLAIRALRLSREERYVMAGLEAIRAHVLPFVYAQPAEAPLRDEVYAYIQGMFLHGAWRGVTSAGARQVNGGCHSIPRTNNLVEALIKRLLVDGNGRRLFQTLEKLFAFLTGVIPGNNAVGAHGNLQHVLEEQFKNPDDEAQLDPRNRVSAILAYACVLTPGCVVMHPGGEALYVKRTGPGTPRADRVSRDPGCKSSFYTTDPQRRVLDKVYKAAIDATFQGLGVEERPGFRRVLIVGREHDECVGDMCIRHLMTRQSYEAMVGRLVNSAGSLEAARRHARPMLVGHLYAARHIRGCAITPTVIGFSKDGRVAKAVERFLATVAVAPGPAERAAAAGDPSKDSESDAEAGYFPSTDPDLPALGFTRPGAPAPTPRAHIPNDNRRQSGTARAQNRAAGSASKAKAGAAMHRAMFARRPRSADEAPAGAIAHVFRAGSGWIAAVGLGGLEFKLASGETVTGVCKRDVYLHPGAKGHGPGAPAPTATPRNTDPDMGESAAVATPYEGFAVDDMQPPQGAAARKAKAKQPRRR